MLLNLDLSKAKNFKTLNHLVLFSFLSDLAQKKCGDAFLVFLDSNSEFFKSESDLRILNLNSRLIKKILIELKRENYLNFQIVKKSAILIQFLHFKQDLSSIKQNLSDVKQILSEKNSQNESFKQDLSTILTDFDTFKQELSDIKRSLSEFKSFLSEKCEKTNFSPPHPPVLYNNTTGCSGVIFSVPGKVDLPVEVDLSSDRELDLKEKVDSPVDRELDLKEKVELTSDKKNDSLIDLSESRECACARETLKNEAEPKKEAKRARKSRGASFDINSLELPEWLDLELWQDYIAHRAEKRAKLTTSGAKRMLREWSDWHKNGVNVNNCIKNTLVKGWVGVFKENANNQTLGPFKSKNENEQSENKIDTRKPSERCALFFDSPEEEAAAWEKARVWGKEQSEKMRKEREERDREIWGDIPEHWRFGAG